MDSIKWMKIDNLHRYLAGMCLKFYSLWPRNQDSSMHFFLPFFFLNKKIYSQIFLKTLFLFMAGSLEYTKLDEKPDFFTFLFVAFVHVWFAISGTDQSWNLTILRSGALLPLKTVCQIPAHSFEFLTWVLYYLPWKSRSSKCLSYFPVGRNIHINYNLKQSSLISGNGEVVGIMKMATR